MANTQTGGLPQGYSQQAALQKVRRLSNEQSLPVDSDVIGFLNDALEDLCTTLNPLRNTESVACLGGAVTLQLPADIYKYDRLTWSSTTPTTQGVLEYPIQELGPGGFVEQTGGMPTLTGGPILYARVTQDQNNQITLQFYPSAPSAGFINCYYSMRPTLWDPASAVSTTNVDSALQLIAINMAVIGVCENRENFAKAGYFRKKVYGPAEDGTGGMLGDAARDFSRRQRIKGSRVRDVSEGPAFAPEFMRPY